MHSVVSKILTSIFFTWSHDFWILYIFKSIFWYNVSPQTLTSLHRSHIYKTDCSIWWYCFVIRHLGVGAPKELTLVLWSYWWKSVDNLALSCMQILIKMYFSEIYYQSLWNQLGRLGCNSNGCNLEALLFDYFAL